MTKKREDKKISNLCKVRRVKISNVNSVIQEGGKYKLIVDFTPAAKMLSVIMMDESELHRIVQFLNPEGVTTSYINSDGIEIQEKYRFFNDIIVIKVGNSRKFEFLVERAGIKRDIDEIGTIEIRKFADSEKTILESTEVFKHLIVNASHIRAQKAIFVNTENDLYNKVDEIIRCGIPKNTKVQYISKWTSYYGLQASNSTPVSMPKCVIVPDLYLSIPDRVDSVIGNVYAECIKEYKRKPDVYGEVKHFDVIENQNVRIETCPFDGMGIVDVSMATQWAKDLGLNYIPGSFQIRLCGVKGCLFVMDIEKYVKKNKYSKIVDIDNTTYDYRLGEFNVILTNSMFKYGKFYNEEKNAAQWKREFHKKLYGYKRTFNICSYAKNITELSDQMVSAYQPLQSLYKLHNIPQLCQPTVEALKEAHQDLNKFLYYIGIDDPEDINASIVPPYYQALYYNHSLARDPYIRDRIENSLQKAIERAYTGKLYMKGNYTVVGSDPYALLQWAFTADINQVTGLLGRDEIYSNYWNIRNQKEVNIWRNPHIFIEHWIGKCVNNGETEEWFRYLISNTIVSIWDTNLMRMNSADTDGDIIATVDNSILLEEVKRVLNAGEANTIFPILNFTKTKKSYSEISDIQAQIASECLGYKNDIGTCTNCISELWGIQQNELTQKYLKIMSVVDSLIIDFPKTSEKTDIPLEIKQYMKKNNVRKQEFMMYLPANKELREKEEKLKEGEKSLFAHDNCTLNQICRYMKNQMEHVEPVFNVPAFDFKTLLYTKDCNIQYRPIYKRVAKKMKQFFKKQESINIERKFDKLKHIIRKDDYSPLYSAFYSTCRNEILLEQEEGRHVSKNIIIDCCILCCYTEEYFISQLSVFNLLWNMFPKELVSRAKGTFRKQNDSQKTIDIFAEKIENKLKKSIMKHKKESSELKLNRLQRLKFIQIHGEFNIYRDEIAAIKKSIPTSTAEYITKRKLLYSLLVVDKKIKSSNSEEAGIPYKPNSDKKFNNSILAEMIDSSNKSIRNELNWLQDKGFIKIKKDKIELVPEKFLAPENIDRSVIYYSGDKCVSGLKKMNRYLNR